MSTSIIEKMFTQKPASKEAFRQYITIVEEAMKQLPNAVYRDDPRTPLVHRWADGLYIREITIPAGYLLTTGIHAQQHVAIVSKGRCLVASEEGVKEVKAGDTFITEPGTKRLIFVRETIQWTTVHACTETELDRVMEQIEFKDFEACDSALLEVLK